MYPTYSERGGTDKSLAILIGHSLYIENVGYLTVDTFADLLERLFNYNCITFTDSLTDKKIFPFLRDAIQHESTEVMATAEAKPLAIRSVRRQRSRWIVPSSTWSRKIDDWFLHDMRKLFTLVDMVKPTPGSLGQGLLRRNFSQFYLPRHTAPNVIALDYMREHGHGGRCDTMCDKGTEYDSLLSLDESDSYLAHSMSLPTGTSYWFKNGHCIMFATWFAECEVTIHNDLVLGPFPVRTGKRNGKIKWATKRGKYRTFLWREQAEDAERAGCSVTVRDGLGWKYLTNDLESYARYMHRTRMAVAGSSIEPDVKKTSVSGLGHFGMKNTYHYLTDIDDGGESPSLLNDKGKPMKYFVATEVDYRRPSMLHWYNYLIMQCARTLYNYALPYALAGRLVMTNYDELLILEKDETSKYPEKHTLESMMVEMGDLRWQRLTNVKILGDRSLRCDQKIVTPGVSHDKDVA
jgi:hypothetical protein